MMTGQVETLEMKQTQLYINGSWVDGATGDRLEVINPATEEPIADVSYGTGDDARQALESAGKALPRWMKTNVYQRAEKLKELAD